MKTMRKPMTTFKKRMKTNSKPMNPLPTNAKTVKTTKGNHWRTYENQWRLIRIIKNA